MLVVHWSPVKNTKHILRAGISKSKDGVFCFPLTGQPNLDKWWAQSFRLWHPRTSYTAYNGFVFRLEAGDFPAAFGSIIRANEKPLTTVAQLHAEFESAIMFRIGERKFGFIPGGGYRHDLDLEKLGREMVAENPSYYLEALNGDPGFLEYIFEHYEIVLSRSIAAKRILRVMSGSNDYGRNIIRKKKEKTFLNCQSDRD